MHVHVHLCRYMVGMPLLALGLGKFVLGRFGRLSEPATLRLLAANFFFTAIVAFGSFAHGQTFSKHRWAAAGARDLGCWVLGAGGWGLGARGW